MPQQIVEDEGGSARQEQCDVTCVLCSRLPFLSLLSLHRDQGMFLEYYVELLVLWNCSDVKWEHISPG